MPQSINAFSQAAVKYGKRLAHRLRQIRPVPPMPLDAAIEYVEQRSANNPGAWESDQEFLELLQKHQPLLSHERMVLTMTLFELISQRDKSVAPQAEPKTQELKQMNSTQQYHQRVTYLSEKIVALIKAELPEEYETQLAIDAALLAQHQLFGRIHMWRLFTGNLS